MGGGSGKVGGSGSSTSVALSLSDNYRTDSHQSDSHPKEGSRPKGITYTPEIRCNLSLGCRRPPPPFAYLIKLLLPLVTCNLSHVTI